MGLNGAASLQKPPRGHLRPYEKESILSGHRSVLSLGEGESDYIGTILLERSRRDLPLQDVHAVDLAYGGHPEKIDRYFLKRRPQGFKSAKLKEFPGNYHGQRFEDLDIRGADGLTRKFDEIISSHSLSYVLAKSAPPIQRRILEKIALHAQKGGVLRSVSDLGQFTEELRLTLEALKLRGVIRDYGFTTFSAETPHEGFFILFP